MEFLNAFGRKTADATAKLTQQAKVLAETTRLQGLITEEKQKMVEQYTQIGKLYVANHRTDYEETFSDMVISIARSEDSIAGYKKQIQKVKGVVVCEKCGEEVSKDTAFCSCCGAPIMDPEKYVRCAHCGAPMEKRMKFCTICGNPRKSGNAAKRTCHKCGAKHRKMPLSALSAAMHSQKRSLLLENGSCFMQTMKSLICLLRKPSRTVLIASKSVRTAVRN